LRRTASVRVSPFWRVIGATIDDQAGDEMGKILIGAFVVVISAGVMFFVWSKVNEARQEEMSSQIATMQKQITQLGEENNRLKGELAKVQSEEQSMATQNDELRKAVAAVKATGKLPPNVALDLNPPK
jgi:septal ring factor EnvC (AmiA/AmiB activator)